MNSLIAKLEAQGKDVSWYYKSNKTQPKEPIEMFPAKTCGITSSYLIKCTLKDHKVFTVDSEGKKYKEAHTRTCDRKSCNKYLCSACNKSFKDWAEYSSHYAIWQHTHSRAIMGSSKQRGIMNELDQLTRHAIKGEVCMVEDCGKVPLDSGLCVKHDRKANQATDEWILEKELQKPGREALRELYEREHGE